MELWMDDRQTDRKIDNYVETPFPKMVLNSDSSLSLNTGT